MRLVSITLLLISLALPLKAGPEEDVKSVISQQIESFKRDDFGAAFEFASNSIRSIFRTPENFGRMVRQGYPMVWRPRSVTFLSFDNLGEGYTQDIEVIDQNGITHYLRYYMILTNLGWRINGVEMLKGNPLAV